MVVEILTFIYHLQLLLSMFERLSILFDRKMNAISAPNEIVFQARYKLWRGTPSTDLSKKILCNYCNLVAISNFVRVLKNSLQTVNLISRGWKGLFDWLNIVKLDNFRVLQQPVRI